jgi:hypothetical protein
MGRMMRNFIESDKVKELFKQVPPGTVEAIGQSNTPLGNLLKGSGVAYPQQQTQTYAPLVQLQQSLPPLQFDNPERAERIESSLGRAAFGPERIREILMQLKGLNFLADGGRIGYKAGGIQKVIPKNLPLTLNEAINKFGFDAVMGKTIQSGGEEPGMYQPGQYTQYYNLMEAESGGGTGLKEQYRPAIGPAGTVLPPKPGTIGYTGPETTTAPVADIAGRRQRIEDSLTRAAFGPDRIREILMQLKESNFLANGGRVGFQEGGPVPLRPMVMLDRRVNNNSNMAIMPFVSPTLNTDNQGRPVNSITGVPLNIETTPTSLPLSGETTPTSLQFDNPERAERIEASLTRAAFGPERIREILMQLKEANYLANGGRVGYVGGGPATTQDYATALSKVGAGTEEQKRRSVSDYAQNEAYGLLSKAASTPGGLSDLYNNYIKGTTVNSRAFDFGRDASTMNTATAMNPQYKQNIIDQIAYTMQQNTPYRKTYPFENASMQELMPAGTVGSKNFESNITTPQEAAALARYIALQRGVDMQQYDAEQAATNAGTLDDFYRNLGLQNSETM